MINGKRIQKLYYVPIQLFCGDTGVQRNLTKLTFGVSGPTIKSNPNERTFLQLPNCHVIYFPFWKIWYLQTLLKIHKLALYSTGLTLPT